MTFRFSIRRICSFAAMASIGANLLGCDDESQELPGIALEQFTEEFRGATCEHITACNFMPDIATCMSAVGIEQGIAQSIASANSGKLTYQPDAGRACVEALRTAPCTGDFLIPRSVRETCDRVFGGRLGEGEPCFHAAECQGLDALCEGACDDACCAGTCKLGEGLAALGEPCGSKACDSSTAFCNTADADPANWACAPKVGPGESCASAPDSCPQGYACDPGTQNCFKQADPGGACNPDLTVDACVHIAEYCDKDLKKCVPYPGVGQPCGKTNAASNICAWGYSFCDGSADLCVALPSTGESCTNACLGGQLGSGIPSALECGSDGSCVAAPAVAACLGQ